MHPGALPVPAALLGQDGGLQAGSAISILTFCLFRVATIMTSPPSAPLSSPPDLERERLDFLNGLGIIDTPPEARIDAVTHAAADYFKVPVALVTLIDSDSQWIKSSTGMTDFHVPRDISFCHHTIQRLRLLVVENALDDPRFCDNPLVRNPPHVRFYAGAPLVVGGRYRLGSFCLVDDIPRTLDAAGRARLWHYARTVSSLIAELHMPAAEPEERPLPARRYS